MDKSMHVMISRPNESRKDLLQGNIDIIRFLKGNEKLKLIRKEKNLYSRYVKREVKELKTLMQKLFESLPEVKIQEKEKRIKKIEQKEKEIIEKPSRNLELEKLEQDIKKLQQKIGSL
jgi:hypothetical protein|tara:strand:+ start:784 stop:1137 length:354 start_codon:yes stop_codon:yes gene_type:complete